MAYRFVKTSSNTKCMKSVILKMVLVFVCYKGIKFARIVFACHKGALYLLSQYSSMKPASECNLNFVVVYYYVLLKIRGYYC